MGKINKVIINRFTQKCNTCHYDDDPCHYLCQECRDGKNWTPKPTLREELEAKIVKLKREIMECEWLLDKCRDSDGVSEDLEKKLREKLSLIKIFDKIEKEFEVKQIHRVEIRNRRDFWRCTVTMVTQHTVTFDVEK